MSRKLFFVIAAVVLVALIVFALISDSRIAAGAGALVLFAGIIYGTLRTETSDEGVARAERGAKEVRDELAEDESRRGTR